MEVINPGLRKLKNLSTALTFYNEVLLYEKGSNESLIIIVTFQVKTSIVYISDFDHSMTYKIYLERHNNFGLI